MQFVNQLHLAIYHVIEDSITSSNIIDTALQDTELKSIKGILNHVSKDAVVLEGLLKSESYQPNLFHKLRANSHNKNNFQNS